MLIPPPPSYFKNRLYSVWPLPPPRPASSQTAGRQPWPGREGSRWGREAREAPPPAHSPGAHPEPAVRPHAGAGRSPNRPRAGGALAEPRGTRETTWRLQAARCVGHRRCVGSPPRRSTPGRAQRDRRRAPRSAPRVQRRSGN